MECTAAARLHLTREVFCIMSIDVCKLIKESANCRLPFREYYWRGSAYAVFCIYR